MSVFWNWFMLNLLDPQLIFVFTFVIAITMFNENWKENFVVC